MSEQPKDDGPAFPLVRSDGESINGMALRDWFAGQALAGLLVFLESPRSGGYGTPLIAQRAYEYADAMLANRRQQP